MKNRPEKVYPYHSEQGVVLYDVVRWPDKRFSMRHRDPAGKYINGTKGIAPVLYHLPDILNASPDTPIFIVEGEKDADTLTEHGFIATTNRGGPGQWKDEYNSPLKDRDVVIINDNDKEGIEHAINVAKRLKRVAKRVRVLELPDLPQGGDVSDWFDKGGTPEQLRQLAENVADYQPVHTAAQTHPYIEKTGYLYHERADGHLDQLTNFTARIVSDISISDGQRTERHFEIEANIQGKVMRFEIPASQFAGLNWIAEKLGAGAILYAGPSRDHTRAAIQILSGNVPERRMYSHLGWVQIDGIWYYLHANGAIGPVGLVGQSADTPPPITSSDLHLPEALRGYKLPEPPVGSALKIAVRASVNFLKVAAHRITVPILAAVYAPITTEADSVYATGPTGAGKTSLAASAQQHYGPEMDATHLPASWSSTANALEFIGFYAKDALMVVDDFVPTGSASDVNRLHAQADRVIRGQANRSGRQRLTSESSLQAARPPRCLILNTGEDIPVGRSLQSRLLIVHVGPNDIDFVQLSESQRDASDGKYAQALSAYVSYVASDYGTVRARIAKRAIELRDQFTGTHRRTGFAIAKLASAFLEFLSFGVASEAITAAERDELWSEAVDAFRSLVQDQGGKSEDWADRFISLIKAALMSGKAHIANTDGTQPPNPAVWGWTLMPHDIDSYWRPRGQQIGWIGDDDDLYLEPEVSYKVVQEMAGNGIGSFTIAQVTLHKRLEQKKLLKTTEEGRGHLTIRKTLQGTRAYVLHLAASTVMEPAQSAQADPIQGSDSASSIISPYSSAPPTKIESTEGEFQDTVISVDDLKGRQHVVTLPERNASAPELIADDGKQTG